MKVLIWIVWLLGDVFRSSGREHARVRSRVVPCSRSRSCSCSCSCSSSRVVVPRLPIVIIRSILVVIGRSGSWSSGSRKAINIVGTKVRITTSSHHGVEIGVVETGATWSRVSRGLKRVNLSIGEIGRARGGGREALGPSRKDVGSGSVGFSDSDVELAVLFDLGIGFQRVLSSVKRHDIRVDMDGDNGTGSVWELLRDQQSGASVLEHEEHQGVPDDALEDHNLDHQTPRKMNQMMHWGSTNYKNQ